MLKKILVPLDGSELAEQALPYAKALAEKFEAELMLIMVLQPFIYPYSSIAGHYGEVAMVDFPPMPERRKEATTYLARIQETLKRRGIANRIEVLEAVSVADGIVEVARQEGMDAIVKTTHGRSGLSRWVYGSVATKVLQEAPCPVFLVRVSGGD